MLLTLFSFGSPLYCYIFIECVLKVVNIQACSKMGSNDPLYCWVILIARIYCYKLSEIVRHSQLQIQKTSQMLPKLSLRIRSWTNNNKNLSTMSPASRVEFSLKTLSYHPEEFSVISKKCCSFHFAFSNECWFANPISPLNDLGESFNLLSL